jgi:hypothetical protein
MTVTEPELAEEAVPELAPEPAWVLMVLPHADTTAATANAIAVIMRRLLRIAILRWTVAADPALVFAVGRHHGPRGRADSSLRQAHW